MSIDLKSREHDRAIDLARFGVPVMAADTARSARIAVVAARFNARIVDRLVEGALQALADRGVAARNTLLVRVAGAWELPLAARTLAASGRFQAIVALGCVIRGETGHYEVIVENSARALMDASLATGVAIANGVLACENAAQADARAGGSAGNKGEEAALAALEMAALLPKLAKTSVAGAARARLRAKPTTTSATNVRRK